MAFSVGDYVMCTVPHDYRYINDAGQEYIVPGFATHHGEIIRVLSTPGGMLYDVWGPGGEQYKTVGEECLKLVKAKKA